MVCRSGFTGEKGYEIFCENSAAEALWDAVMKEGEKWGIQPTAYLKEMHERLKAYQPN